MQAVIHATELSTLDRLLADFENIISRGGFPKGSTWLGFSQHFGRWIPLWFAFIVQLPSGAKLKSLTFIALQYTGVLPSSSSSSSSSQACWPLSPSYSGYSKL